MKLHQWGMIATGIVIFVVLITFPFWYGKGKTSAPTLSLETPAIQALQEKRCIADTAWMRSNHMKLLKTWRDDVVREGNRVYTAKNGKAYDRSLSGSCLKCHSNKEQFCDRCHNYLGAKPNCFDCHIIPGEVKK